ncbi:MAG: putative phage abortive infection protein [Arcobacteraceae bacterium]|nr:putative phage abortive infection protein [Arcobacteraceae bacterium]
MLEVFKSHKWWFGLILGCIILYIALIIYMTFPISQYSIEKAGQFGDSFGVLNSLFSGLAFIALVITIYLQQQDMRDSKKEVHKQNFETTFFNLIKIHNDSIANFREIHIAEDKEKHSMYGGEAISNFLNNFKLGGSTDFYTSDENLSKEENKNLADKDRNINPENVKNNIKSKLGRKNLKFIENVYSILNLIDRSEFLDEKDKSFYLETLHSQISDEELVLIFYYTHAKHSNKKLLLEKYCFFKDIDEQLLDNWEEEIKIYKKEAFDVILWQYL